MFQRFPSRQRSFAHRGVLTSSLIGVSVVACTPFAPPHPFHAPGTPQGRIAVTLVPAPGVHSPGPHLVTLGIPFSRGSLTKSDLATVRVLDEGIEIAAHVNELAPYRSIVKTQNDGNWVRVARIQIEHTFRDDPPKPESIIVEWGHSQRMRDVSMLVDPRRGWHPVAEGSFSIEDLVSEPDVYAVLPKDVLSRGALRTRYVPLDNRVTDEMDPPASFHGRHLHEPLAYDIAQKNYFYGLLNEPQGKNPYRTNANGENNGEAWLFDRASSMYVLYLRSGSARVLREAVRASVFYERLLVLERQKNGDPSTDPRDIGAFFSWRKPRANPHDAAKEPAWDPKYSYAECLALTHWLTGDDRILDKLPFVVKAFSHVPSQFSPNHFPKRKSTGEPLREAWTERHVAFKLLAAAIAFEITGRDEYRDIVMGIVENVLWHQNQSQSGGLFARVPDIVDGGLYHFGTQHDPDEAGEELIASPWMSALLVDAMVRVYGMWEDPRIARFIARMGGILERASKVHTRPDGTRVRYPDYLIRPNGSTHTDHDGMAHSADVMGALAWADYFARLVGEPKSAFRKAIIESPGLYEAFTSELFASSTDWALSPARRYAWMFRTSAAYSFALGTR